MIRFTSKFYTNMDEVLKDIDIATSDIVDKIQSPNVLGRNQYIPIPANQSELSMKVTAFKQRAHELVRREKGVAEKRLNGSRNSANGYGHSANGSASTYTQINASSEDSKMVLTLYGNAAGPKQLFSSLQLPTKLPGEGKDFLQTIREAGLPNGITTTQIVPIQKTGLANDKKRIPTLGELFPTPSTVPALLPPKPSKLSTTRSSTVGWYQPSVHESILRGATYFKQPISTGQWLDYSNATMVIGTKRKQRDRALSLGGTKAPPLDEPSESEAAKLETLFRSAYSSFAPTKDDAAAVAPTGDLERIWWQQVGEKNFWRFVVNADNFANATTGDAVTEGDDEEVDEVKKFEKLVEDLENDPIDPSLLSLDAANEKSAEEKDVEEILQGISELLETLNSYQRIRHLSLNSSSRPAGLLAAPDTTSQGTPAKPSEAEQATYEILKSQLTLMIATLPPYAVAKLDPDRLAELSISTKIEVKLNDHKGVMEEDEAGVRAKVAAMSAASAAAQRVAPSTSLHRPNSAALYGNQYASTQPRVPSAHQYYTPTQTPIRPPSSSMQRPPATSPAPIPYQTSQRPPANAPYRSSVNYGTPTNYAPQNPRPVAVQQSYAPQPQPQYHHSPAAQPSYLRAPSQGYQQQTTPSAQMNGRYPSQQAYPHQVSVPQNNMNYQYGNGVNMPRQVSPQKMYTGSPQPVAAQPRPAYVPTPTPSVAPQNRQSYSPATMGQVQPTNGSSSQPGQLPYAHQTSGLTNYSTFMTQEQQSNMIERQRSAMAQQQASAQQQARSNAQPSMGSPSKGQANGANPLAAGS